MRNFKRAVIIILLAIFLLGMVYPLSTYLIGQCLFAHQANGSLLLHRGRVLGSTLIAQPFTADHYFWARPVLASHSAMSHAEDHSINSFNTIEWVHGRSRLANQRLPWDLLFNSASGLDPHISLENAKLQMARVAKARGLRSKTMRKLIRQATDANFAGIWGSPGVNVLKLNWSLDKLQEGD